MSRSSSWSLKSSMLTYFIGAFSVVFRHNNLVIIDLMLDAIHEDYKILENSVNCGNVSRITRLKSEIIVE